MLQKFSNNIKDAFFLNNFPNLIIHKERTTTKFFISTLSNHILSRHACLELEWLAFTSPLLERVFWHKLFLVTFFVDDENAEVTRKHSSRGTSFKLGMYYHDVISFNSNLIVGEFILAQTWVNCLAYLTPYEWLWLPFKS